MAEDQTRVREFSQRPVGCTDSRWLLWRRGESVLLYIKIIKNEVGCRDDTVPKTVDTRRHCEEE